MLTYNLVQYSSGFEMSTTAARKLFKSLSDAFFFLWQFFPAFTFILHINLIEALRSSYSYTMFPE